MMALLIAGVLFADPVGACESRLASYDGWRESADTVWSLDLSARDGGGGLNYVGAVHSRDPADPQFEAIDVAFRKAAPTMVFYEGPDRGVAGDRPETIRTRGESGFARWLAAQAGAAAASLEPSPVEQFRALSERFDADEVELFFVLREAARLRDREGLQGQSLDQAVGSLLARMADVMRGAGLTAPFTDLAGLDAAYARLWPQGAGWRTAPSEWFDPTGGRGREEGRRMAAINAASSAYRDVHMYRRLASEALEGERVFAVVGRNHVPMQAEALRCALSADQGE